MTRDVLHVATYSTRPAWVSHERFLTPEEAMVLVEAVAHDPLPYRRIYDLYGERAWNLLNGLKKQGCLTHPGYNRWQITEKGRIAAALATTKASRR